MQHRDFSISKHNAADRQSDRPGHQNKARDRADRADRPAQLGADADRNPHDVRPGHQLAEGQSLGKFLLVHPSPLLDHSAASPNKPTAETAERNLEKADE